MEMGFVDGGLELLLGIAPLNIRSGDSPAERLGGLEAKVLSLQQLRIFEQARKQPLTLPIVLPL